MKIFYTYFWLREDGTVYYVGKGNGMRAHRKGCPKDRSCILIQEHPSEQDAFIAEIFFISYYGRKDCKTGLLRNRTDGGEGVANPSEETRKKISMANKGKKISEKTRKKLSDALMNPSEEVRQRLRETRVGMKNKKHSEETKIKIAKALLGHEISEQTCKKIGETLRGRRLARCQRGHEFAPENTIILKTGTQVCRTCRRVSNKAWKELQKEDNVNTKRNATT